MKAAKAGRKDLATSTKKAAATPGGGAGPRVVGRQFTKKTERAPGIVELDFDDYFDIERSRARSAATLKEAGYKLSDLYGPDGACFALERARLDGHEDDSPVGLAAAMLWHCHQLELLGEVIASKQWERAAAHAYALGRLDAFRKAYVIQSQSGGGGRPATVDHAAVRRFHARIATEHDATSQTATRFGLSTRAVRKILAG